MTATTPLGRLVWYECLAHDRNKVVTFYSQLLGWGAESGGVGGKDYTMFTREGMPHAGAFQMPPGDAMKDTPSHWLMYVGTPDPDATVKQATALGAKVYVAPQDIPGVGRFAVMADPQGVMFAVYRSAFPVEDVAAPTPLGGFSWHELATPDMGAAWTFYQKLFGWETRDVHDMGPMGMYQLWSRAGTPWPLGAMFTKPPQMPMGAWILYIRVADLDASVAKVKQLGGQVLMGPMEVPGGDRIAQCTDTDGAFFALHFHQGPA